MTVSAPLPATSLRIVVWNACGAMHRKLGTMLELLSPDIAIVPECANEVTLRAKAALLMPACSMVWVGDNRNKGLAVFGFGDYEVRLADVFDRRIEWVAPIDVSGPTEFALLAVWAMNQNAKHHHPDHIGARQPLAALDIYRDWYDDRSLVVAGDFNNNALWDKVPPTSLDHSRVVEACEALGLVSAYHADTGEAQGSETTPTIYWRNRSIDGPTYHLDHAFIPHEWAADGLDVQVGSYAPWVAETLSDHVPMLIEVSTGPGVPMPADR